MSLLAEIKNDISCPIDAPLQRCRVPPFKMVVEGLRATVLRDLFLPIMVDGKKCVLCFGGNQYLGSSLIPVIKEGLSHQCLYDLWANVRLTENDSSFYAANEFYLESIEIHVSVDHVSDLIHLYQDMAQKSWIQGNMNFQREKEDYIDSLRPMAILLNQAYGQMYSQQPSFDVPSTTLQWMNDLYHSIANGVSVSVLDSVTVQSTRDPDVGMTLSIAQNKITNKNVVLFADHPPVRQQMVSARVKGILCVNQFGTRSLETIIDHALARTICVLAPKTIKASLICVDDHNIVPVIRMIPESKKVMTLPNNGNYISFEKVCSCDMIVGANITAVWVTKSSTRSDLAQANLPILTSAEAPQDVFGPQSIALAMDHPFLVDPSMRSRIYMHREHVIKMLTFGGGVFVHDHIDFARYFSQYVQIKTPYRVACLPHNDSISLLKAARWILDSTIMNFSIITPITFMHKYIIKVSNPDRSHIHHFPYLIKPAATELPMDRDSLSRTYPSVRSLKMLQHVPIVKPATMLVTRNRYTQPVADWIEQQHKLALTRYAQEEMILMETTDHDSITFIRNEMARCIEDAEKWEKMIQHIILARPYIEQQCSKLERVDPDMMCTICLSRVRDPVMNVACGHVQCIGCMDAVLRNNPCCPQCRVPIRNSLVRLNVPNLVPDRYCIEGFGSKLVKMVQLVENAPTVAFVIVRDGAARQEVSKVLAAHNIPFGITLATEKHNNIKALILTFEECQVDIDFSKLGSTIILMEVFSSKNQFVHIFPSIVGKCIHNPMVNVHHLLMKGSEDEVLYQLYGKLSAKRKREE